jgi:DGQHR domain-containing protein
MKPRTLTFDVVSPTQGEGASVACFVAPAATIGAIARIERAGRNDEKQFIGFQRPQIAKHIRQIRDYLESPSAMLLNPIIVGFNEGATLKRKSDGTGVLTVDLRKGPPGMIVDGQQRFTALSEINNSSFQVPVTAFICSDLPELLRQFVLINNVRPLPKTLIFELLRLIPDMIAHASVDVLAEMVIEALSYQRGSPLNGLIHRYTNPSGVINAGAIRKVFRSSLSDGALRLYAGDPVQVVEEGTTLIGEFFHAVRHVFRTDWDGHTSKTSRLVHGAGIVALGYLMEQIHVVTGARTRAAFADGLRHLVGKTAWTSGVWVFGHETRSWNSLQNVSADIRTLSLYLTAQFSRGIRESKPRKRNVRR